VNVEEHPAPAVGMIAAKTESMTLSIGPQHPSTHGVLQVVVDVAGETVERAEMEIGYLHTGIEKSAENLFWTQAQTVIERMDYLNPVGNALCYTLAAEQLLGITDKIPPRAQAIRVLNAELTRISSHCVWVGTHAIDLGAISNFWYAFDIRENILDLIESFGGARMHPNYLRIGGVNGDLPDGFLEKLDALIAKIPGRMREMRRLLQNNPIWRDRTIDVGVISAEDAVKWSLTGPSLRGSGIAYDVRKAFPYSGYDTYEFDVPVRGEGDAYARFLVRLDEMDEAVRIIRQVRERLNVPGPVVVDDPKIVAPPKETIAISMEALIHHFKIVSEGFRVPPGDVYQAIESPRGELGYYLVSNGNNRPYRIRTRPPSMYNLQCLKQIAIGNLIADMVVMIGSLDPVFGEVDR
jgi:NADH-quinone oxidoreductase subunit D